MRRRAIEMLAAEWLRQDPDPETREATRALLASDDPEALEAAFGQRLQFGTAGLRGQVGPGPNRMNQLLVRRVTAGLASYVLAQVDDAAARGVVVGYDGRTHSRAFAEEAARVLGSHGMRVYLADTELPTPRVAFAVLALEAAAGIVVTASHNPPSDNGYKVFWSNGAQIVPPHDRGISRAIDALDEVAEPQTLAALGDRVQPIPGSVHEAYFGAVQALRVHREGSVRVVYTAMHGVGKTSVVRALTEAGHTDLHLVAAQAEPDGAFPTVAFPNPEEPGALDLSMALADEVEADVILANDPDADRLAVAIRGADGWVQLTGNQVGVLLADDLLASGHAGQATPMVATTIVSSAMLRRIAEHHGAAYAETLTGFKWIANAAIRHDRIGRFVLGFEEALGYSAGSVVRDKDGVSAALLLTDLAGHLAARGQTLRDRLDDLYRVHGVHVTDLHSVKLPGRSGSERIAAAMTALRSDPPTTLGGVPVAAVRDLSTREGRRADGTVFALDLPASNVLAFDLADGSRVLARPSGTEPKLKFYAEVRQEVEDSVAEAEALAAERVGQLVSEIVARAGLA
jgi:phosphomannomutase